MVEPMLPSVPSHVLVPKERLGPVGFGDTRREVIARLGEPDQPFVSPELNHRDMHYRRLGLAVICFEDDDHGGCHWIATNPWAALVTWDGLELRGSMERLVRTLAERGVAVRRGLKADRGSSYFDSIGLYLGRDDPDQEDVDTVAGVAEGYWGSPDPRVGGLTVG